MQRQVQRLTLPSMALPFLLPSPQPLASTLSNTQHPPTTLLNMVLQAIIIQPNMLLQEVTIMPAMLLRATMLPMAHTVVVATMLHMEVMVETPIQPLLLQHLLLHLFLVLHLLLHLLPLLLHLLHYPDVLDQEDCARHAFKLHTEASEYLL